VPSFGVIQIRISDPRSLGSWCIKETVDSSVPLMHHDPSDLGSLIRIRITPKERTLSYKSIDSSYGRSVAGNCKIWNKRQEVARRAYALDELADACEGKL